MWNASLDSNSEDQFPPGGSQEQGKFSLKKKKKNYFDIFFKIQNFKGILF